MGAGRENGNQELGVKKEREGLSISDDREEVGGLDVGRAGEI